MHHCLAASGEMLKLQVRGFSLVYLFIFLFLARQRTQTRLYLQKGGNVALRVSWACPSPPQHFLCYIYHLRRHIKCHFQLELHDEVGKYCIHLKKRQIDR